MGCAVTPGCCSPLVLAESIKRNVELDEYEVQKTKLHLRKKNMSWTGRGKGPNRGIALLLPVTGRLGEMTEVGAV